MSEKIARAWLDAVTASVADKDLAAHLNLISKQVSLTGVPGFDTIGFDDWAAQCTHEFAENILQSVSYSGLKLLVSTESRIMFKTFETLYASDGTTVAQGIEVLLALEDDGQWRVIQERILPDDEVAHDGLQ